MGKPIVSTRAGVNGLDLTPGEDFVLAESAEEFARAIEDLFANPARCARLAGAALRRVQREFNWDSIAHAQTALYRELLGGQLFGADALEERALLRRR